MYIFCEEELATAARDVETLRPRASVGDDVLFLTAAKSGVVSLFLQYASRIGLLLGEGPFIVL